MPTRQLLIALLTSLFISPCLSCVAQNQQPNGPSPQTPSPTQSPPVKQRMTFTVKYSPVFSGNTRQTVPAIIGTFPNHRQARFVIDTGTDAIVVSEKLTKDLGLSPMPFENLPANALTVDGNSLKQVTLPDLSTDAATSSSPFPNALAFQHMNFNGQAAVIPQRHWGFFETDGLLGTSILMKVGAILFDGPKQELTFVFGGNATTAEREYLGFSSAAVSIELTAVSTSNTGLFTVPITLDNNGVFEQVTVMLDTGSNITTIPRATALALGLESISSSISRGVGGTVTMVAAPVQSMKIGGLTLHNILVSFSGKDKQGTAIAAAKGGVENTLGMDILAGYRVLIDLPARRMYLMPEQPEVKIVPK